MMKIVNQMRSILMRNHQMGKKEKKKGKNVGKNVTKNRKKRWKFRNKNN